jgi:hypothetical protein
MNEKVKFFRVKVEPKFVSISLTASWTHTAPLYLRSIMFFFLI